MEKIKYDYNCKHYFGIISAESEEEVRKILHKDHTGGGDKHCNWSKKTKIFRDLIAPFGDKKLEMFARIVPEGWDVWGNEVDNSIKL